MSYALRGSNYFQAQGSVDRLPAGIYQVNQHPFMGTYMTPFEPKTDELIAVPGTPSETVNKEIAAFMAKRPEFAKYGFTHKRGYLLYGPPGTGKSSIAQLVAQQFVKDDGIVIHANAAWALGLGIEFLREDKDRKLLFMMEDVDSDDLNDADVLSYLDGTKSVSGLVVMLTTNYKSKLPPRVANRPGRFDQVLLVDRISEAVQLAYLERIQARVSDGPNPAQDIVQALSGIRLTLAHLKEAFLAHVVLGEALPTIKARFEKMASTINDDDGEQDEEEEPVKVRAPRSLLGDGPDCNG